MKFPPSEDLGYIRNIHGELFHRHFYGENEGAAVITGPIPENTGRMRAVSEFYREPAASVEEARGKLELALRQIGGF